MKLHSLLFCLLIIIATSVYSKTKAQAINVKDSLALVDLYNSTNGPGWRYNDGWLNGPVSTWNGITTYKTRVTEIDLNDNYLIGNISSSIGQLTTLRVLLLSHNQLAGSIPISIGRCISLEFIDLNTNTLTGSIPSTIGKLTKLYSCSLDHNQLSGSIPSSIGKCTNLSRLHITFNQLSGTIPSSIGNLINLNYLDLGHNNLSGSIPSSIGKLTRLYFLGLYYNQLSNSIPNSIGNLTNLTEVYLYYNKLSGALPLSLGNLTNLEYLEINNNKLTGEIPSSFSKLRYLSYLYLQHNQLSQSSNFKFNGRLEGYFYILKADLAYNHSTFNGLEFIAKNITNARYSPQAPLSIHQQNNILSVYAGGTTSNNTYIWFNAVTNDSTIIKGDSTFQPMRSGTYFAKITNAIATKLTLTTDTINYTMSSAKNDMFSFNANAVQTNNNTNHFLVYPNPAKDLVHVQTEGTALITIADASGKILIDKNINGSGTINISDLANGVYFIQNTTTRAIQKIIVLH